MPNNNITPPFPTSDNGVKPPIDTIDLADYATDVVADIKVDAEGKRTIRKNTLAGSDINVDPEGRNILRNGFPSNSHAQKSEKKVEKVITGSVVKRKQSLIKRITETFLGDDIGSVTSYVIHDVLIPAAKSTFSDMVSGGIERLLFGESRGSRTRRDKGKSYVSYNNYYKSDNRDDRRDSRDSREASSRNRTRHNFDDIILNTRGEAEEVLSHLVDLTIDYGMASVADLYDLVGITSNFTDNKYGWNDLSSATVSRIRDGYLVDLPRTIEID